MIHLRKPSHLKFTLAFFICFSIPYFLINPLQASVFDDIAEVRPGIALYLGQDKAPLKKLKLPKADYGYSDSASWKPEFKDKQFKLSGKTIQWDKQVLKNKNRIAKRWTFNLKTASKLLFRLDSHAMLEIYLNGKPMLRGPDSMLFLQKSFNIGESLKAGDHELIAFHPINTKSELSLTAIQFSNQADLALALKARFEEMDMTKIEVLQDFILGFVSENSSHSIAIAWFEWMIKKNISSGVWPSKEQKGKAVKNSKNFIAKSRFILSRASAHFYKPFYELLHREAPLEITEGIFTHKSTVKKMVVSSIRTHEREFLSEFIDRYSKYIEGDDINIIRYAEHAYREGLKTNSAKLLGLVKSDTLNKVHFKKYKALKSKLAYRPPLLSIDSAADRAWQEMSLILNDKTVSDKALKRIITLIQPVLKDLLTFENQWLSFSRRLEIALLTKPELSKRIRSLLQAHFDKEALELDLYNPETYKNTLYSHELNTKDSLLEKLLIHSFQQGQFDMALGYAKNLQQSKNKALRAWATVYRYYSENFLNLPVELCSDIPADIQSTTIQIAGAKKKISTLAPKRKVSINKVGETVNHGNVKGMIDGFNEVRPPYGHQLYLGKRNSFSWTVGHDMILLRTPEALTAFDTQFAKTLWKKPLEQQLPKYFHYAPTYWEPLLCDRGFLLTEFSHDGARLLKLNSNGETVSDSLEHPDYINWRIMGQPGGGHGHTYVLLREKIGDYPVLALAKIDSHNLNITATFPLKAGSSIKSILMGKHFHLNGTELIVTPGDGLVLHLSLGKIKPNWIQNIPYSKDGLAQQKQSSSPLSFTHEDSSKYWVYLSEMQSFFVFSKNNGALLKEKTDQFTRWYEVSPTNSTLITIDYGHRQAPTLTAISLKDDKKLWSKTLFGLQVNGKPLLYGELGYLPCKEGLLKFNIKNGELQSLLDTPLAIHSAKFLHGKWWLLGDHHWSVNKTQGEFKTVHTSTIQNEELVEDTIIAPPKTHWVAVDSSNDFWQNRFSNSSTKRYATKWKGFSLIANSKQCALLREPVKTLNGWKDAKVIWQDQWKDFKFNKEVVVGWSAKEINVYRIKDKALLWKHTESMNKHYGIHKSFGIRSIALSEQFCYIQFYDGRTEERDIQTGELKQTFSHHLFMLTQANDGLLIYTHGLKTKVYDPQSKKTIDIKGNRVHIYGSWILSFNKKGFEAFHKDKPSAVKVFPKGKPHSLLVIENTAYTGDQFVYDLKKKSTKQLPHAISSSRNGVFYLDKNVYHWHDETQLLKIENHDELNSWMKQAKFKSNADKVSFAKIGSELHFYDWNSQLAIIDLETKKWAGIQLLGHHHAAYINHIPFDYGFARFLGEKLVWMLPDYGKKHSLKIHQLANDKPIHNWQEHLKTIPPTPLSMDHFYNGNTTAPPELSYKIIQQGSHFFHSFTLKGNEHLEIQTNTPDDDPFSYVYKSRDNTFIWNKKPLNVSLRNRYCTEESDDKKVVVFHFKSDSREYQPNIGFSIKLFRKASFIGEYRLGFRILKEPSNTVFPSLHIEKPLVHSEGSVWEPWLKSNTNVFIDGLQLQQALYQRRLTKGSEANFAFLNELLEVHREKESGILLLTCFWLEKIEELREKKGFQRNEWSTEWSSQMKTILNDCIQKAKNLGFSNEQCDSAFEHLAIQCSLPPSKEQKSLNSGELHFVFNAKRIHWLFKQYPWLIPQSSGPFNLIIPIQFIRDIKRDKLNGVHFLFSSQVVNFRKASYHKGNSSKPLIDSKQKSYKPHELMYSKKSTMTWNGKTYPVWRSGLIYDASADFRLNQTIDSTKRTQITLEELKNQLLSAGLISNPAQLMKVFIDDKQKLKLNDLHELVRLGLPYFKTKKQFRDWSHWIRPVLAERLSFNPSQSIQQIKTWLKEAKIKSHFQQHVFFDLNNLVKGKPLQLGPFDLTENNISLQPLPEELNWKSLLTQTWQINKEDIPFSKPNSKFTTRNRLLTLHQKDNTQMGLHYVAFKINSPKHQKAYLFLNRSATHYTQIVNLWFNGEELSETPLRFMRGHEKNEQFNFELRKGLNSLLIKTQYENRLPLKAILGDRSGAPLEGVIIE